MPRPSDLTENKLICWEKDMEAIAQAQQKYGSDKPRLPKESRLSIFWLIDHLTVDGCSDEDLDEIVLAAEMRLAFVKPGGDPWPVVQSVLERYHQGEADIPGDALLEKLFIEQYGDMSEATISQFYLDVGKTCTPLLNAG